MKNDGDVEAKGAACGTRIRQRSAFTEMKNDSERAELTRAEQIRSRLEQVARGLKQGIDEDGEDVEGVANERHNEEEHAQAFDRSSTELFNETV